MNKCRAITNLCSNGNDWRYVWNTFISQHGKRKIYINIAPIIARTHVTASKHATNPDHEKPPQLRAIDLARKIQQDKKKTDLDKPPVSPQEKRVVELKQYSQQLQNVHPNVLAKHLHKSVLFQNKDVVVINKPYGVPVHDKSGGTSISSVMPVLSKMMDGMKAGMKAASELHPCLALEKEVTGTLILARSEKMLEYVQNLHRNHQVERKYWVVMVGVPVPSEGVIDIPVIEREVPGSKPHFKMGLSPVYRVDDSGEGLKKVRANRQAQSAVTKYRVLSSGGGCSLVELQALTGVKHQMRVHMALALGCPILGDHKYSHWTKLAPQRLPEGVLRKLGLEQSKVRHLPLHLHGRQLTLPGHGGQQDVDVSCPLPKYFIHTLRRLQLTRSTKEEPQ